MNVVEIKLIFFPDGVLYVPMIVREKSNFITLILMFIYDSRRC